MGQALELVTGFVTAPSTTFTAWTLATGNSLTIRNASLNSQISLLAAWALNNAAGSLRIRSPRLHDNVDGIRMRVDASDARPIYPIWAFQQKLIPQDALIAEQTGSAVGGQIETGSFLVHYMDLPGISGRFITPDQLRQFGVNIMGVDLPITTGAGGGYTGQAAINSSRDNFKANTNYALLGYRTDVQCASVRIQGADVGNLGIGGPGIAADPQQTSTWFAALSAYYGLPCIPVFQAANKGNILVDVAQTQAAAAVNLTFFLVELAPNVPTT